MSRRKGRSLSNGPKSRIPCQQLIVIRRMKRRFAAAKPFETLPCAMDSVVTNAINKRKSVSRRRSCPQTSGAEHILFVLDPRCSAVIIFKSQGTTMTHAPSFSLPQEPRSNLPRTRYWWKCSIRPMGSLFGFIISSLTASWTTKCAQDTRSCIPVCQPPWMRNSGLGTFRYHWVTRCGRRPMS